MFWTIVGALVFVFFVLPLAVWVLFILAVDVLNWLGEDERWWNRRSAASSL